MIRVATPTRGRPAARHSRTDRTCSQSPSPPPPPLAMESPARCGACGCHCNNNAGGENVRRPTETEREPLREIVERAADRIVKFIFRGLLILLWVYLYNSMRRYAINYIGSDTWFSTFVIIVVAVPVAEFFCIVDQVVTTPLNRRIV